MNEIKAQGAYKDRNLKIEDTAQPTKLTDQKDDANKTKIEPAEPSTFKPNDNTPSNLQPNGKQGTVLQPGPDTMQRDKFEDDAGSKQTNPLLQPTVPRPPIQQFPTPTLSKDALTDFLKQLLNNPEAAKTAKTILETNNIGSAQGQDDIRQNQAAAANEAESRVEKRVMRVETQWTPSSQNAAMRGMTGDVVIPIPQIIGLRKGFNDMYAMVANSVPHLFKVKLADTILPLCKFSSIVYGDFEQQMPEIRINPTFDGFTSASATYFNERVKLCFHELQNMDKLVANKEYQFNNGIPYALPIVKNVTFSNSLSNQPFDKIIAGVIWTAIALMKQTEALPAFASGNEVKFEINRNSIEDGPPALASKYYGSALLMPPQPTPALISTTYYNTAVLNNLRETLNGTEFAVGFVGKLNSSQLGDTFRLFRDAFDSNTAFMYNTYTEYVLENLLQSEDLRDILRCYTPRGYAINDKDIYSTELCGVRLQPTLMRDNFLTMTTLSPVFGEALLDNYTKYLMNYNIVRVNNTPLFDSTTSQDLVSMFQMLQKRAARTDLTTYLTAIMRQYSPDFLFTPTIIPFSNSTRATITSLDDCIIWMTSCFCYVRLFPMLAKMGEPAINRTISEIVHFLYYIEWAKIIEMVGRMDGIANTQHMTDSDNLSGHFGSFTNATVINLWDSRFPQVAKLVKCLLPRYSGVMYTPKAVIDGGFGATRNSGAESIELPYIDIGTEEAVIMNEAQRVGSDFVTMFSALQDAVQSKTLASRQKIQAMLELSKKLESRIATTYVGLSRDVQRIAVSSYNFLTNCYHLPPTYKHIGSKLNEFDAITDTIFDPVTETYKPYGPWKKLCSSNNQIAFDMSIGLAAILSYDTISFSENFVDHASSISVLPSEIAVQDIMMHANEDLNMYSLSQYVCKPIGLLSYLFAPSSDLATNDTLRENYSLIQIHLALRSNRATIGPQHFTYAFRRITEMFDAKINDMLKLNAGHRGITEDVKMSSTYLRPCYSKIINNHYVSLEKGTFKTENGQKFQYLREDEISRFSYICDMLLHVESAYCGVYQGVALMRSPVSRISYETFPVFPDVDRIINDATVEDMTALVKYSSLNGQLILMMQDKTGNWTSDPALWSRTLIITPFINRLPNYVYDCFTQAILEGRMCIQATNELIYKNVKTFTRMDAATQHEIMKTSKEELLNFMQPRSDVPMVITVHDNVGDRLTKNVDRLLLCANKYVWPIDTTIRNLVVGNMQDTGLDKDLLPDEFIPWTNRLLETGEVDEHLRNIGVDNVLKDFRVMNVNNTLAFATSKLLKPETYAFNVEKISDALSSPIV